MLIQASAVLQHLRDKRTALADSALERPAEDYAAYLALCAEFRTYKDIEKHIIELARAQEDEG